MTLRDPDQPSSERRYPIGAELQGDGVHFRVWAPDVAELSVVLDDGAAHALTKDERGYFAGAVAGLGHGSRYAFVLDGSAPIPDPASRFQPDGPLGFSMVVDPGRFTWTDQDWPGVEEPVVYELHIGTFTPEGTYAAAIGKLGHLAETGITMIEMMPVSEFAGTFGWGYDGVDIFAPTRLYGEPDELRRFVDAAHGHGIAVIMDVVYNHFGPVGNYFDKFTRHYFTDRYITDWGRAINYEDEDCFGVREFVTSNARYWIDEFHMDGLRLDATQNIYDFAEGREHIVSAVGRAARKAGGKRYIFVVAENEPQEARLVRDYEKDGFALNAIWNDDFHHSCRVALTGRNEAYLGDFKGTPQEFVSAAKYGFLFQGQRSFYQEQARGTFSKDLTPGHFVVFIQNHDQIANSGHGLPMSRLAGPAELRAMAALLILGPNLPMLFQGQEFNSTRPFLFFAELTPDLADPVANGRANFLAQFPSLAFPAVQRTLARPSDPDVFARCKLDWSELERHRETHELYKDLLRLRRDDAGLRHARRTGRIDGAVLSDRAFLLRFFGEDGDDRLLIVNLGPDLLMNAVPEPLVAPPEGRDWTLLWSSEHPAYGGEGQQRVGGPEVAWTMPGHATSLLAPGKPSAARKTEREKALHVVAIRQKALADAGQL